MLTNILILVVGLTLGSAPVYMEAPCHGRGCTNITMYLGPRLGTRVISVPQHKPIRPDDPVQVDISDEEPSNLTPKDSSETESKGNDLWSWGDPSTLRRPLDGDTGTNSTGDIRVVMDHRNRGILNISWRGYTGEDVRQVLKTVPEPDLLRVNVLILDGNRIRNLPVLVFPVEFEYTLEELSLSDNLFTPSFLSSYSRFELSRLSRLKALRLSRCGFFSIELPSLPFLQELDLSYNALSRVPSSLSRLGNLVQLSLRGNRITYVTDLPLASLRNLRVIDLGDNGLREIQGKPLENHRYLSTVKLDHNSLRALPPLDYERRMDITVANNFLECSCALLAWIGRPNFNLGYDLYERCRDGSTNVTLFDLRFWPDKHHNLCDDGTWMMSRLWDILGQWYRRNHDILRISFQVGVIVVVLSVVVLLMRSIMRTKERTRTGYSILDDQRVSVSTVSGPRTDV